MKIQTRLSLFSLLSFGSIFFVLSFAIYLSFSRNIERETNRNLEKSAFLTAFYYLEKDELSEKEYQPIYEQFNNLINEFSYQVYDESNAIVYGTDLLYIENVKLDEIRKSVSVPFNYEKYSCFGIFYEDNEGDFVVITFQSHDLQRSNLHVLLKILSWSFGIGLLVFFFVSRWVASRAYKPFRNIIGEVHGIKPSGDIRPIRKPATEDELDELVDTFNELLERINQSMLIQKNFVRYVSHEFRTPLAGILGNLEVFSLKGRDPEDYRQLTDYLINQIKHLNGILDTLMWVSDLKPHENMDTDSRIDEIIWDIIERIKEEKPSVKIFFDLDVDNCDELRLRVKVEYIQLFVCLYNLIHNAVKFSNQQPVTLILTNSGNKLVLKIIDNGIGFSPDKLRQLKTPFMRGRNAVTIEGNGLGLTISLRILEKNNIEYCIESEPDKGTVVAIYF